MSGNDGETLLHYNANYNETIQVVVEGGWKLYY